MKILFVCQQYIHAARWINQLKDSGHQIFLFDCLDKPIHPDLKWTNYTTCWSKRKISYIKGECFLEKKMPKFYRFIESKLKVTASEKLEEIIKEIQPDLVHSLEMQSESYPLIKVRKKIHFKWAYFSWGSDLYLYQNDKKHKSRIQSVLSNIDYLFTDNKRDVDLANDLKFIGKSMPILPGGGGYHLEKHHQQIKPIDKRRLILVKGYHHWAGKALYVLNALELIVEDIRAFDIYIYSAHDIVVEKIEELNKTYNLNIEYSSRFNQISQNQLLEKFGQAKIAIGNNISDGVPNTLLEAIICGAFPIQSNPGGASEDYIVHNKNGLLIKNPEDSKEIAKQIKKALINDELLKNAFSINQEIAKKLDHNLIKKEVLKAYKQIEADV